MKEERERERERELFLKMDIWKSEVEVPPHTSYQAVLKCGRFSLDCQSSIIGQNFIVCCLIKRSLLHQ